MSEDDRATSLTLEARLDRLDEIANEMESAELTLDRSMELFEEAIVHLRAVEEALSRAQVRVDELVGQGDAAELVPLDTSHS